jgi:GNAT superfamily N-acetyltransferase
MRIECCGPRDADIAADLLARFFAEEGFATPPERLRAHLALMLAEPGSAIFLAREAGRAVGVATVTTVIGLEFGRSAELEDLYVLPEARGRGVASALIAAVRAWCRERDCATLAVAVTPEGRSRRGLLDFYTRRGFSPSGRTLLYDDLRGGGGE